ncbi:SDR family oxidoreductase [Agromyces laixinhei]|uniref:SDR family oxidoreductase n=1 Tax=Agromyces laixinhei TaxID=2585717 RepID=UPI0011161496|nr:SDR family oxidoreductase [Agromyces laixinhei]
MQSTGHSERVYVVTGADSGIGARVAEMLAERGARVIRCGLGDGVEVNADLSQPEGRARLVEAVRALAPDGVDGLALVAGVGVPTALSVRLNFFGTIAVIEGLRPLLAASAAPRVVAVSSASALSAGDDALIETLLGGGEAAAVAVADRLVAAGRGSLIYRSTKIALNRWVRRHASDDEWAGRGILLNAVAPGLVATETAMATVLASDAQAKVLATALPQPLGMPGPVEAVAEQIAWLIAPSSAFTTGQILFVDGGADVVLRGEGPYAEGVRYGPLAVARMLFWSAVARMRGDRVQG